MVVGEASIVVIPDTAGFAAALDAESQAAFGSFKKDAETAGEDAGAGLRGGVREQAGRLDGDLAEIGASAGGNLRKGVHDETAKLGDDLEKDGKTGGDRLSKGIGTGLSKLANLASNTGLPIGGLSSKLDQAGKSLEDTDHKSKGFSDTLDHLGGYALLGVGAAAGIAAIGTVKLAEGMQTADASIASAEGVSTKFAKNVGDGFLSTAGKSEFSGQTMAKAFAEVAGQLKSTEGHALSAGESLKFESAAAALAEGKQIGLGEATSTTAKILQAFGLHAGDSAHVTDVLYQASNATGMGVEQLGTQLTKVRSKLGETSGSVGQLAGLLVDMTDHGITGRAAMTGLNTGLNTLLKTSDGVATAASQQNAAYAAMTPALKTLAKEYETGRLTSEQFKKATEGLPTEQATLAENFAKASTAVQTAELKYKEMGLTVFDAQGKFVGMGSIIEQLAPRFAHMTEQQQLATASTIFGAGAARQMVAIIKAGPEAYDRATQSVEKHGAAEAAARKQAETLHGEEKTLGAELVDVGTKIGEVLIPVVTKMIATFVSASTFILAHKAILIGLAAVVTGVLGTAIAVFTVNKMVAFGQSFVNAGKAVGLFRDTAVADMAVVSGDAETMAATTTTATGQMELDFEGAGAAAGGLATDVTTADGTIETENVAAGASFTAMLGPIGLVAAAIIGLKGPAEEVWKALSGTGGPEGLGSVTSGYNKLVNKAQEAQSSKEDSGATLPHRGGLVGGGSVEQQIKRFWESKGFSPAAAAGFVGNAALESSLNVNEPGGGLYQQSGASNPGAVQSESLTAQSEEVLRRLSPSTIAALKNVKNPAEAARIIESQFEVPAGSRPGEEGYGTPEQGTAHLRQREEAALKAAGGGSLPASATPSSTSTGSAPSAASVAAAAERATAKAKKAEEAAQKAALEKEVKAQEKSLAEWVTKMLAEESKKGPVERAKLAQEIAEHKAYIATVIKEEKAGATEKQAVQKAQAKQEATEQEAGQKERTRLDTAITSGSLSQLNTALDKTHAGALAAIEGKLQATHKAALEKLTAELVKTWREAELKKAALEKEESAKTLASEQEQWKKSAEEAEAAQIRQWEAQEKAEVAAINEQAQVASDKADGQAQQITDATKVMLDKQAEVGLSGTAEITAHLQTVYDELTGSMDKAINEAKVAQDETAGKGAVAEAEAAARTSRVESEAKVKEAEAQRQLELAKNTAASSSGGSGISIAQLVINGAGLSSTDILNEFVWGLKTGKVPVAEPVAA